MVRKLLYNQDMTPPGSIIVESDNSDAELSPRAKKIVEAMENEIEEEEDPEEKRQK